MTKTKCTSLKEKVFQASSHTCLFYLLLWEWEGFEGFQRAPETSEGREGVWCSECFMLHLLGFAFFSLQEKSSLSGRASLLGA